MNNLSAAEVIIKRAIEFDRQSRFIEALTCYQEGLNLLFEELKSDNSKRKPELRSQIERHMTRAEAVKKHVNNLKTEGKYHEQRTITDNSRGNSYATIFSPFLDETIVWVRIEDAYLITNMQCQNLVRFCELLVSKCSNLKSIRVQTKQTNDTKRILDQKQHHNELRKSLLNYGIEIEFHYSETIHDRQIMFSNGWIVKIGRGLDYFKKLPDGTFFSIGSYDFDLRNCNETTVDIFHSINVKFQS